MEEIILRAILAAIGLISLASLGAILLFIAPETESVLLPVLVSIALFLSLASGLTFAGRRLRRRYQTEANRQKIFAISFREAVILAALLVGFLWLNRFSLLNVWSVAAAAAVGLAIEYLFLVRRQKRASQ